LKGVITICFTKSLQEVSFVGGGGLVLEEMGQADGERVDVVSETFAIFFTKAIGAKVYVYIEIGYGGAEHAAVIAVDGTSVSIQFDKFLVKTIAKAPPVGSLYALDVENFAQHTAADHHYADVAQVDSP